MLNILKAPALHIVPHGGPAGFDLRLVEGNTFPQRSMCLGRAFASCGCLVFAIAALRTPPAALLLGLTHFAGQFHV